ncbi:MAG: RlmE family RNA methyltransferase [Candidatus Bathyarchaeia archaeon]|jgi:23S rRNA (uridine2552-2'-O)-methyltransferase
MPSRWLHERKTEHYYNKAKEEGYRSRASYKLKQLNEEFKFFEGAKRVLDMGAAPGGWLQVAGESIKGGLVVGVDLKEIFPLYMENVETIVGDVTDPVVQEEVLGRFQGEKADVVLSDMAPNVMGVWEVDDLRQIYLAHTALSIADKLLKEDGWMVVKVFQGKEHEAFIRDMRAMFEKVYIVKPLASRKGSAEVYVVAKDLRRDRVLPEEFRNDKKNLQIVEEEETESLPGENLPDYGEPEEYGKKKPN